MALTINLQESIVEYERVNTEINGIIVKQPYLYLSAARDKWIFPWTTRIPVNIKGLILPSNTIGLIEGANADAEIDMFTLSTSIYSLTVPGKTKGILPRKIYAGETVVRMTLLRQVESHVVDYSE